MITQRFRYFLIACKDFRTKPDQEKHCKNESRLHQDSHDFNPLLGSVEGNNRFVFGFITLVGSIWHRTFRAATASFTAIGLWMCAPPSPVSVSRVEKFSFVLLGVSLPAERERERELRSRDRLISLSKFLFEIWIKITLPNVHTGTEPRFLQRIIPQKREDTLPPFKER